MKITGTLIKNFLHCPREAYLYYYGINFRTNIVRIGELMHEEQKAREMIFEKIKVDDIKGENIIEYKKTSSNIKGTKLQLLWYLKYFEEKGVKLKGIIKDLTYKKEYVVELNEENKKELENTIKKIKEMLNGKVPKRQEKRKMCKQCSFFDYCWAE